MTDEAYCQRFVLQSEAHCCLESLVQLQAMVESLEP
jgi:hypothetical protein